MPNTHLLQQGAFLRLPQGRARVALRSTAELRLAKAGEFPTPVRLGAMAVARRNGDISAWIASLVSTAKTAV